MNILRRSIRWIGTKFQQIVDWIAKPSEALPVRSISENSHSEEPMITEEELKQIRERIRRMDMLEATIITILIMVFIAIALSFIVQ